MVRKLFTLFALLLPLTAVAQDVLPGMQLPSVLKYDSATQASFRNPSVATLQGNAGGLTLNGGTASTDALTLNANDETFADANTGRINLGERVLFNKSFTTSTALNDSLIRRSGTVTSAQNINIFDGFRDTLKFSYSVGQLVAISPAFWAAIVMEPTAAVTDNATYSVATGFHSTPTYAPNISSGTATAGKLIGYSAAPITRKTNAGTVVVPELESFSSYNSQLILDYYLKDATVNHLSHFRAAIPSTSNMTIDNEYGLRISALASGTNIYGVNSAITSGANKYFLYDSGGAQSYLTGKFTTYNGVATEGFGVPAILDEASATAQSAAISDTNFTNCGTAGLYRIQYYLFTSTASGTATAKANIKFNDGTAARTVSSSAVSLASTANFAQDAVVARLGSGSVTYGVSTSGTVGSGRFSFYATCERLT